MEDKQDRDIEEEKYREEKGTGTTRKSETWWSIGRRKSTEKRRTGTRKGTGKTRKTWTGRRTGSSKSLGRKMWTGAER